LYHRPQAGIFFRTVLNQEEKERLVDNMAVHMANAQKFIQVKKA
jgi:catalase